MIIDTNKLREGLRICYENLADNEKDLSIRTLTILDDLAINDNLKIDKIESLALALKRGNK